MPGVPLQQDYARDRRYSLRNIAWRLIRAYHSVPSRVRSLPPCSVGMRRSLRSATRIGPHSTDKWWRAHPGLPHETVRSPSARSGLQLSHIFARPQNRPKRLHPKSNGLADESELGFMKSVEAQLEKIVVAKAKGAGEQTANLAIDSFHLSAG